MRQAGPSSGAPARENSRQYNPIDDPRSRSGMCGSGRTSRSTAPSCSRRSPEGGRLLARSRGPLLLTRTPRGR
eukprot:12126893-Alexandrium_andersonii.AAC.1